MAELLSVKGWSATHSLGLHLREALTDEYYIVCEPVVQGQTLDAVLVGPQGLFVLHTKDWQGTIRPSSRGPWRERLESGRVVSHPNPAREAQDTTKALRTFLRDEALSLRPTIHHYVVLTNQNATLTSYGMVKPSCVTVDDLAQEITSVMTRPNGAGLDSEARETLALALRDRGLTANQRATQPFIFRSGGIIGMGKKAWTIRQALDHMDQHPEEGIHHLRNGTWERWLSGQGAFHLATLAQEVMRKAERDPRVSLETFLLGTGLRRRPRLSIKPRRINIGHALSGDMVMRHLRVGKGRGRGYVHGSIRTSDSWLRVEPSTFSGYLEAVVSADTEPLLITEQPSRTTIFIESNTTEEPVAVPVLLHVEAMPATLNQYLLRPLIGFLLAGLAGACWGGIVGRGSIPAPAWLAELGMASLSPGAVWAIVIGLFWALLGLIRGFLQNRAWPILHAAGRWLARMFAWGAALSVVSSVLSWVLRGFYSGMGEATWDTTRASITLLLVALAILPATIGEITHGRARPDSLDEPREPGRLRRALMGVIGVTLVVALAAGVRLVGPAVGRYAYDLDSELISARQWASNRWVEWESTINGYVDQLYVRYHDRREPMPSTPIPSERTPTPVEWEDMP